MKKLLKRIIVSLFSILIMTGCASNLPKPYSKNITFFKLHLSKKEIRNTLIDIGKKNGWYMTEFDDNKIIAEKLDGKNSTVVTIVYNSNSYYLKPNNSDLQDILDSALSD